MAVRTGSLGRGYGMLALFVVTGAVFGGMLGDFLASSGWLSPLAPYLTRKFPLLEMPPVLVNLYVLQIQFSLSLYPNFISLLGIIAAVLLFRRL
ncbi:MULTISPECIES: DUF4321 domain-containing protein [Sporomusaceae]|jgi:hypothetical protein|uniref:DUF4321 domain-containing protein n=1 Tax=Sporomusaceae TaxID=1843490 RepID=UPI00037FA067|nr:MULTISPECIES: DUF4321 domain-containing protein [Sporomusaceae]MDD3157561.1 DUF4321 domain-containing protein [Anaeromusa sp.]MEA4834485.1 DUF4321 domain-containing protein [Anaeromusa sp.]NCB76522.1 DUF4321 domain-containing protein [Negativicutes bacterium]